MYEEVLNIIACEQWQADISGGVVADNRREITDKKLLEIGLTRQSPSYIAAYTHAQYGVNPAT